MIALVCAWTCLFAVYLVLAGQVSADEIGAGALCATAGVAWWICTRRVSTHRFALDAGTWAAAGRACRAIPGASLSVAAFLARALVRRERGVVVRRFYVHGRRPDPRDAGRRAAGVLAASLAPDSFVLRTPPDRDEVVVHGFSPDATAHDPRWLI